MLVCSECNKEEYADYFIIHNGKVLCLSCAISYMVYRLERVNKMLEDIERRLDKYANRKGEEGKS